MCKNEELRKKAGFPSNRKHLDLVCLKVKSDCPTQCATQVIPVTNDNFENIPDCLGVFLHTHRNKPGNRYTRTYEFHFLGGMPCSGDTFPEPIHIGNTAEQVNIYLEAHYNFGPEKAKEIIAASLQPK